MDNINVKILRYDPSQDKEPYNQTFQVPYQEGISVLNVLDYIYDNLDSSLGYYSSCRISKCNGCLSKINGRVAKTCSTIVNGDLIIEPIPGCKVIRDLIIDL